MLLNLLKVFSRSIKVEGGPDNKVISKFNGPLIVNNKVTVNSPKGLESNNIFLQGDATVSRKYTVGIATPSLAGNPGDVVYNANPNEGGYVGWVYTTENGWRRFGSVSLNSKDADDFIFDSVGIATTSAGECALKVGSGTSLYVQIMMVLVLVQLQMDSNSVLLVNLDSVDLLLQQHLLEMVLD